MIHNKQNVSGNTSWWNIHFLITYQCMKVCKIIKNECQCSSTRKVPNKLHNHCVSSPTSTLIHKNKPEEDHGVNQSSSIYFQSNLWSILIFSNNVLLMLWFICSPKQRYPRFDTIAELQLFTYHTQITTLKNLRVRLKNKNNQLVLQQALYGNYTWSAHIRKWNSHTTGCDFKHHSLTFLKHWLVFLKVNI